ncbi:helix-turn-helix domain-containing protein, partial [Pseudomonas aeruginosa]
LRFEPVALQDAPASDTSLTLQQVERQHIKRVLREVGGKVEQASLRLGIPRSTLYQKIKMHGIVAAQNEPG